MIAPAQKPSFYVTPAMAAEVLRLDALGELYRDIAGLTGIHKSTVSKIARGKWRQFEGRKVIGHHPNTVSDPTPEEIEARALEIRRAWNTKERRNRRGEINNLHSWTAPLVKSPLTVGVSLLDDDERSFE